jgi:fructokinase
MGDAAPIVCWGEILWDEFPDGSCLGGAPSNVAYHLGRLGSPVSMVSRVGNDAAGRRAIDLLAAAGVDVRAIQIDPSRPTGSVSVTVESGEPRYTLRPDCAWEAIAVDAGARRAVRAAAAICFGSLSQRTERGRDSLQSALSLAAPTCLRVFDPNLRPGHDDAGWVRAGLLTADVVKLSESELTAARAWLSLDLDQLAARLIAITRGAGGCRLVTPIQSVEHAGFPAAPGGDNVGAGDAFLAALVHLALREAPLARIAELANRYAAHVASRRGATPAIPPDLVAALQEGGAVRDARDGG